MPALRVLSTPADLGAAPATHSHAQADILSLVSDLAGKAAAGHGHSHSALTGVGANDHHAELHAAAHATGQPDALTPAAIGASATGHSHPSAAVTNADNAFSAGQGIRAPLGSGAAGLYAPWLTGDTHPAIYGGSAAAGSNQTGVEGDSESGTGVLGAGQSGIGVNGTSVTGIALAGTFLSATDTNNIISVAQLRHRTTQTPVAGFGTGLRLIANSDTTADRNQALLASAWSDSTDATRSSYLALYTAQNGSLNERVRIGPSGATAIRATVLTTAAGLYVPWVSGDSLPALVGGASTSGNTQVGVQGLSDSNAGVVGQSSSAAGVSGTSATNTGVLGIMTGAGSASLEGRYTGSGTGAQQLLVLRNGTSGTGGASTGGVLLWLAKSDTTANRSQADLTSSWGGSAIDASRKARVVLSVYDTAAREVWRGEAGGSAPMIGFLGATAVGRPTAAAAATDAATTQALANSLRTILINFGLAA